MLKALEGNRTYIGYTVDVEKRLGQHNGKTKGGAKSTRGKQWKVVRTLGPFEDKSLAMKIEWAWKRKKGYQSRLKFVCTSM